MDRMPIQAGRPVSNSMGHGSMVPQKVGQVDQFIEESSLVNIQKTIE